jgi:hypothetical protein
MKHTRKRLCFFIAIEPYISYKAQLTGIRAKACGLIDFYCCGDYCRGSLSKSIAGGMPLASRVITVP